jgi:hypothetical protein
MSSTVLQRPARDARNGRSHGARGSTSRLGWMGLTFGLISLDLEALVFLAALYPVVGWFEDALLRNNPALVITITMLALGGPPAIAGLLCATARRPSGWRGAPAVAGVALCALGLAIPISYAAFALMYLRGLI